VSALEATEALRPAVRMENGRSVQLRLVEQVAEWAEQERLELVLDLIEEWADLQTERLVREVLGRPVGWYRLDRGFHGSPV
jgi:hypothetical protein